MHLSIVLIFDNVVNDTKNTLNSFPLNVIFRVAM